MLMATFFLIARDSCRFSPCSTPYFILLIFRRLSTNILQPLQFPLKALLHEPKRLVGIQVIKNVSHLVLSSYYPEYVLLRVTVRVFLFFNSHLQAVIFALELLLFGGQDLEAWPQTSPRCVERVLFPSPLRL